MEFKRLFTREEAERTLPLVRRIVADILKTAERIREAGGDDARLRRHRADLQDCLAELEAIGCFYKDWSYSVGLVDFPALIDGQHVFLCWRSDEPGLAWYHGIEDGYRGRRPLNRSPAGG
jgi:hypothetical protein